MIIGISGYIGSGKDTVGSIIQAEAVEDWEIKKFAGKLKQIASLLTGIPVEKFEDQEFKKTYLGKEWNYFEEDEEQTEHRMTVREFLQRLGTEGIRTGVHTNAWVNALFADYTKYLPFPHEYLKDTDEPNWIITDCRFPNEAQAIKDKGGVVIRVNRHVVKSDSQEKVKLHPSETSLDAWKFDYIINNNGTIDELTENVKNVLKDIQNNNKD